MRLSVRLCVRLSFCETVCAIKRHVARRMVITQNAVFYRLQCSRPMRDEGLGFNLDPRGISTRPLSCKQYAHLRPIIDRENKAVRYEHTEQTCPKGLF